MANLTAVLATFDGPLDCLAWTLTSLLLRSDGLVDDIIVSINGGDTRNGGDVSLQDTKQRMCEHLADMGYPVRVVRSWSRIGFSQPFDLAIPLAKNDSYLFVHDDTMVLSPQWATEARAFLADPEAGVLVHHPMVDFPLTLHTCRALEMPAYNTAFVVAKSQHVWRKWVDYYINRTDRIGGVWPTVMDFHARHGNLAYDLPVEGGIAWSGHDDTAGRPHSTYRDGSPREYFQAPEADSEFDIIKYPVGSWVMYDMQREGRVRYFSKNLIYHWMQREVVPNHRCIDLLKFEQELKTHPLWDWYVLYCPHKATASLDWPKAVRGTLPPQPTAGPKILACVGVYDRTYTVNFWSRILPRMERPNTTFVLAHNYNGPEPDPELRRLYEGANFDYYLPRPNIGYGTGIIQDMLEGINCRELNFDVDWDIFMWYTDDNIPNRLDLITESVKHFDDPDVMLLGYFTQPYNIRTTALAIRRSFVPRLIFHGAPCVPRRHGDYLEHEFRNIAAQVVEAGYKVAHNNPEPCDFLYDPERFRSCERNRQIRALAGEDLYIPEVGPL